MPSKEFVAPCRTQKDTGLEVLSIKSYLEGKISGRTNIVSGRHNVPDLFSGSSVIHRDIPYVLTRLFYSRICLSLLYTSCVARLWYCATWILWYCATSSLSMPFDINLGGQPTVLTWPQKAMAHKRASGRSSPAPLGNGESTGVYGESTGEGTT